MEKTEIGTSYGVGGKGDPPEAYQDWKVFGTWGGIVGRVGTQIGTVFLFICKFLVNFQDPD